MTIRCCHQDPAQRPNMEEMIGFFRRSLLYSRFKEADPRNSFEACKTQGRDGLAEEARGFTEELDKARYTGNSPN